MKTALLGCVLFWSLAQVLAKHLLVETHEQGKIQDKLLEMLDEKNMPSGMNVTTDKAAGQGKRSGNDYSHRIWHAGRWHTGI